MKVGICWGITLESHQSRLHLVFHSEGLLQPLVLVSSRLSLWLVAEQELQQYLGQALLLVMKRYKNTPSVVRGRGCGGGETVVTVAGLVVMHIDISRQTICYYYSNSVYLAYKR